MNLDSETAHSVQETASRSDEPRTGPPSRLSAGMQAFWLSRRLGRVLLRLTQSRRGFTTASLAAARTSPLLSEHLAQAAYRRHDGEAAIAELAVDSGVGWATRLDVIGRWHRAWLKAAGRRGGAAAIISECLRGEASLRKSLGKLTRLDVPPTLRSRAQALAHEVDADMAQLQSQRMAYESQVETAGPLTPIGSLWATIKDRAPDVGVGSPMPGFRAPASTGQTLDSERFRGKLPLVVFFVPDVVSRRSGRRIGEFNRNLGRFGRLRTQVVGVVPDTAKRIRRQADRKGYNLPLLSDPDESIHRSFGIEDVANPPWGTFIIDSTGIIARTFRPTVRPGHVHQVLASLRALKADAKAPMDPVLRSG